MMIRATIRRILLPERETDDRRGLQGELVYNNASTIISIYYNGQLQMYTRHVATLPNPRPSRVQYYSTQPWALTGNPAAIETASARI